MCESRFQSPMRVGRTFLRDRRGASAERLAAIGGVVAVACVTGVHLVDMAAKNGALPRLVFKQDDDLARLAKTLPPAGGGPTRQSGAPLDYAATASTNPHARPILLDPCTGKPK